MSKWLPVGVIPAMVTPATDDGADVDVSRTRTLTRRLIDSGVHGLFVCASTGEAPLLTRDQRRRVIAAVAEENKRALPLLVGVGAPSTNRALEYVRDAEAAGANCVVALPNHFYRVTDAELEAYFAAIADASSVPTLLYNYPALTSGQNVSPAMAARLASRHNVIGIKDSSGDIGQAFQYIAQCGPEFAVLTGMDTLMLPVVLQGGSGTICAVANVFPELLVELYALANAGELAGAKLLQKLLVDASSLWGAGTMPAAIKAACAALGVPVGPPFAPVAAVTGATYEKLAESVRSLAKPAK